MRAIVLLGAAVLASASPAAAARGRRVVYHTGTGFFVSDDGHFVINAHVVAECTKVVVKTEDGKVREAARTATDTTKDLAILKLDMGGDDAGAQAMRAPPPSARDGQAMGHDLGGEIGGDIGVRGHAAGELGGDIGTDLRSAEKSQPKAPEPKDPGVKAPEPRSAEAKTLEDMVSGHGSKPNARAARAWRVVPLRLGVRLGEGVEAFGFPHADILSSAGNFTIGNVTALAGLGDDPRFLQISAPVQAGNSGGPLLDESGNLIGIVSMKLNAMKVEEATHDFMQNVNFAIKSAVLASYLDENGVSYKTGKPGKAMEPADIADQARAMSGFVVCK